MRRSHFRVLRAAQRVDQAALIRLTLPGAGGLDRAVGDYLEREIDEIGAHELNVDHDQPVNRPCLRVVIDPEPVEHVGEVLAKPRDALDVAVDGGRAAISRLERLLKLIRKLGGCLRYRKILCLDCRQSLPARIGNEDVNVTKILTSPALKAQPPNLLDLPLDYQRRISLVECCNGIVERLAVFVVKTPAEGLHLLRLRLEPTLENETPEVLVRDEDVPEPPNDLVAAVGWAEDERTTNVGERAVEPPRVDVIEPKRFSWRRKTVA